MFSLFENIQYAFELLGQKKGYEDDYDYVGVTTIGRSICVYAIDDEINETKTIAKMNDIALNVPDYFLEYWRDDSMAVLTNVTFLELSDDCCYLETMINGFGRAYRISHSCNELHQAMEA